MSIFDNLDKTKIHTRQISTETYVVDEDYLLVEGVLKDDIYSEERLRFLEETCWAWRRGGKLQQTLLEKSQL